MQIDFIELIKNSYKFTWKYKFFVIFIFIYSLIINLSSFSSRLTTIIDPKSIEHSNNLGALNNLTQSDFVVYSLVTSLITLILVFISWYFTRITTISFARSIKHENESKTELIGFKKLWSEANTIIGKVMLYDLAWFSVAFAIGIIIMIPLFIVIFLIIGSSINSNSSISNITSIMFLVYGLICCVFIILLPIFIIIGILQSLSNILVVNYGFNLKKSVSTAWGIMKKEVGNIIIYSLSTVLIELPYFLIIFLLSILSKYIFINPFLAILSNTNSIGIAYFEIFIASIIYGLIYTIIISPFIAFFIAFSTRFNIILCDKYVNKSVNQ